MRCILHIGTEKTGTTTLQRFLRTNRDRLRRQGLLVPTAAGIENQSGLAVGSYLENRRDDLTAQWQANDEGDIHRFRLRLRDALIAEITGCGAGRLIFSSEHLQSRLTATEEIASLRLFLEAIGVGPVEVVVYLRRPADILNSLSSTLFRNGHHMPCPPGPDHHYLQNLCNHRGTIERWRAGFGREAVRPRLYSTRVFVGGSILDDFSAVAGIDTAGLERPAAANRGLSAMAAEILHRVNARMAVRSPDRPLVTTKDLVAAIDAVHGGGPAYSMPAEAFECYDEAFAESDEWVRREFFPERESLWEHATQPPGGGCGLADESLERIAERLADLCVRRGWCRPRGMVEGVSVPGLPRRLIGKAEGMIRRGAFAAVLREELRQAASHGSRP